MTTLSYLIPVALFLGGLGLAAFLWALKSGQYEDLDGAAVRILADEDRQRRPADGPDACAEPNRVATSAIAAQACREHRKPKPSSGKEILSELQIHPPMP